MKYGTTSSVAFDLGVSVLSVYDADGFLGIQADVLGEEDSGSPALSVQTPFGFLSRPRDPSSDGTGCSILYGWMGDTGIAWPGQDPRFSSSIPQLKGGGSVQYGATGSFDLIDGANGSKSVYVPYNFSGSTPANAMLFALDVTNAGSESIQLVHGAGMAFWMTAGGKNDVVIKNKKGDAYLNLNDDGGSLNGNFQVIGSMKVGVNPVAPITAVPVVLFAAFEVWVTAMQAWMTAIVAAGATASPPIAFPPPPPLPVPSTPTVPGIDSRFLFAT